MQSYKIINSKNKKKKKELELFNWPIDNLHTPEELKDNAYDKMSGIG